MRADFDLARSVGTAEALKSFLDRYADRSDEFAYQLARQLYDDRLGVTTRTAVAVPQPAEPQTAAGPAPDGKSLIRDTQAALNTVGCDAGSPDGVAGRRTQAAFADYIAASGSRLTPSDLGSEAALREIRAAAGRVCKPVVAAPQTAAAPAPSTPSAPASPAAVDMSGVWRYSATCAFLVKIDGSVNYSRTGANSYSGKLIDSLGQVGKSNITVSGRTVTGTNRWPSGTETFSATLSASGASYSGTSSRGCRFYSRR